MVTVSVQKGDRLSIVADAWHMEEDSESCVIFGYTYNPLSLTDFVHQVVTNGILRLRTWMWIQTLYELSSEMRDNSPYVYNGAVTPTLFEMEVE